MCSPWFCVGLGWLPIITGVLLALSVLVPYMIAVGLDHVTAFLPYISDTGTTPPESCVFGQLLNLTAAAALACIYVRMKQVRMHTPDEAKNINTWNNIAMVLGIMACLGMSMVANFQELNVMAVHMIGAFMCFGLGVLYSSIQTWISYRMHSVGHSSDMACRVRLVLSIISSISFIMTFVFTNIAMKKFDGENPLIWHPYNKGYTEHMISTISEWTLAIGFQMFFFTFIRGFQKITIVAEIHRYDYTLIQGINERASPDV